MLVPSLVVIVPIGLLFLSAFLRGQIMRGGQAHGIPG
jgi:hypothetical protein